MAKPGFFVTGTDTGVGKTLIARSLIRFLTEQGLRVAPMKPVAAGCLRTADGLRNEDALALMTESNVECRYEVVNPYAYEPPIAPHIAAREVGAEIELGPIGQAFEELATSAECVVTEGVGGWLVPLAGNEDTADLAARLGLPVILVVGMRLGCLNHALLTAEAIRNRGLELCAWVASCIDPSFERLADNIATLEMRLDSASLGTVPYLSSPEPDEALRHLQFSRLPH